MLSHLPLCSCLRAWKFASQHTSFPPHPSSTHQVMFTELSSAPASPVAAGLGASIPWVRGRFNVLGSFRGDGKGRRLKQENPGPSKPIESDEVPILQLNEAQQDELVAVMLDSTSDAAIVVGGVMLIHMLVLQCWARVLNRSYFRAHNKRIHVPHGCGARVAPLGEVGSQSGTVPRPSLPEPPLEAPTPQLSPPPGRPTPEPPPGPPEPSLQELPEAQSETPRRVAWAEGVLQRSGSGDQVVYSQLPKIYSQPLKADRPMPKPPKRFASKRSMRKRAKTASQASGLVGERTKPQGFHPVPLALVPPNLEVIICVFYTASIVQPCAAVLGAYAMGAGFVREPLVVLFASLGIAIPTSFLLHEFVLLERFRRRNGKQLWSEAETVASAQEVDDLLLRFLTQLRVMSPKLRFRGGYVPADADLDEPRRTTRVLLKSTPSLKRLPKMKPGEEFERIATYWLADTAGPFYNFNRVFIQVSIAFVTGFTQTADVNGSVALIQPAVVIGMQLLTTLYCLCVAHAGDRLEAIVAGCENLMSGLSVGLLFWASHLQSVGAVSEVGSGDWTSQTVTVEETQQLLQRLSSYLLLGSVTLPLAFAICAGRRILDPTKWQPRSLSTLHTHLYPHVMNWPCPQMTRFFFRCSKPSLSVMQRLAAPLYAQRASI